MPSASSVLIPTALLIPPAELGARLGHAQMERVRHLRGEHSVGADHRRHVRRLDRDLELAVVELLEQLDLSRAAATSASAWSFCASSCRCFGSEPELAPMRIAIPALSPR